MISKVIDKILLLFKIFFISIFVLASIISFVGYFATSLCSRYSYHFFDIAQGNIVISLFCIPLVIILLIIIKKFLIVNLNFDLFKKLVIIIIFLKFGFVLLYYSSWRVFSDFEISFNIARKINDYKNQLVYRSYFPEWCNFITLERLLCQIGISRKIFFIIIENFFSVIVAFFIMKYSLIITDNLTLSYLSCILYLCYPTTFFYSFIFKPDTIALMLSLLASTIFAYSIKCFNKDLAFTYVLRIVFAILLIVIANCFKSIATIFVIAFFIVYFINCIKSLNFIKLIFLLILVLAFIVSNKFTNKQFHDFSEKTLETNIDKDATWHYLCVGLNMEGEGQISIGSKSRFYTQIRSKYGYDIAVEETKNMLKNSYSNSSLQAVLLNFLKKTIWFLQDDVVPVLYFNKGDSINLQNFNGIQWVVFLFVKYTNFYVAWITYFLILVLSVKVISSIRPNNLLLLYNNLCIFGFFLLLIISEAQSRYKSNIMPFIIFLASNGVFSLYDQNHNKLNFKP